MGPRVDFGSRTLAFLESGRRRSAGRNAGSDGGTSTTGGDLERVLNIHTEKRRRGDTGYFWGPKSLLLLAAVPPCQLFSTRRSDTSCQATARARFETPTNGFFRSTRSLRVRWR